ENRTFEVEVLLPPVEFILKPNQVVVLQLRDYLNESALAVPTRLIQKDEEGQFIYAVDKRGTGNVARKIHVTAGISSDNQTEIISGLKGDELIVDQGFRDLTEGVEVAIAENTIGVAEVAKKI
ncbi:MAG TPA: efflux RND transporter periplasmic adaptor subunit, partial [Cyclobacteriaceae bacterium]